MTATATRSAAAPDPLVRRFAEALARLNPGGGTVGLAVSGGPDSMAMLLLAQAAVPGRFEVATVDHGLRFEAAAECALVEQACAERGIPCSVLRVTVGEGNLQDRAREARYRALAEWARQRGLVAVATAHHADDQAETLLMRLNRGSGVAGLAGVRERTVLAGSAIPLIRPLLSFRRAELAQVIADEGLAPVQDPSNQDDRFDRVRLRKALAAGAVLDPLALSASAAHLAQAEEALAWAAGREWAERVELRDGFIRYAPHAPRAIALRIVERAIASLGGSPRGGDVGRLLDKLIAETGGNVGGVLARVEGGAWVFRPEPPRR
jgi:tRNA(Ile)-lysidine synthase